MSDRLTWVSAAGLILAQLITHFKLNSTEIGGQDDNKSLFLQVHLCLSNQGELKLWLKKTNNQSYWVRLLISALLRLPGPFIQPFETIKSGRNSRWACASFPDLPVENHQLCRYQMCHPANSWNSQLLVRSLNNFRPSWSETPADGSVESRFGW